MAKVTRELDLARVTSSQRHQLSPRNEGPITVREGPSEGSLSAN